MTQVEKIDKKSGKYINYLYFASKQDESVFYRVRMVMV